MAYGPGSWGSSSGGSYGAASWSGGGGAARSGTSTNPKRSNPEHDLVNGLVRIARTLPNLSGGQRRRAVDELAKQSQGLSASQLEPILQSVDYKTKAKIQSKSLYSRPGSGSNAIEATVGAGGDLLSKTLKAVSAPGRGVLSGLSEYSRQYEQQGRPFLPDVGALDVGKIASAAGAGFQGNRIDTPMSIAKEAGDIRAKQGESTQAFGTLPGSPTLPWKNDLRTNPIGGGKVGNFAYDIGGQIGTDPLTYLSFGLGALAKAGIRGSVSILGAERTAQVVEKGASVLNAEEKARLAEQLAPKVYEGFIKGVRGGVKVAVPKLPTPKNIMSGHFLGTPQTIIPGPLRGLRAAKIIEGTGGATDATRAAAVAAEQVAKEATDRAGQLHATANLAEVQGTHAAGDIAAMRHQADEFSKLAEQAGAKANEVRGAAMKEAGTVAERLTNTTIGRGLAKVGDLKPVQITRGLFVPRAAVEAKFGRGVAEALNDARVRYRGTFQSSVEDDVNTLLHAARQTGVTNDELTHIIGPALDIGGAGKAAAIPDTLRPMYDALVNVRDRFTTAQVAAGVTHENALHLTDEYFPRILTDEATKVLKGKEGLGIAVPGEASITRAPSGNLKARTADINAPISEINPAFAAEHGGAQKFEANPLTAFSKRSVSANQDIATKQYVDEAMKITDPSGNPLITVAKGAERPPPGYTELNIPGVGRIHAPDEIAQEVRKSYELLINDEALKGFVNGLDKWMTLWKGYATVPLPFGLGFHERNAMGNVFLNHLAGISPLDKSYVEAQKLQRLISKGAKEGDVYKYMTPKARKIVEEARQHDVVGEGFFGVDLPKNTTEPVNVPFRSASAAEKGKRVAKAANPLNTNNALISSGRKLGRAIEENARLAHFINKLDEFGNATEAARSVKKYLFDYGDLTAAERQIFKRTMAFYTFTRKNLPLEVGALLQTPGKFSHLQEARISAAGQAEKPKGLYPSYLPELGGVPLPMAASEGLSKVPGLRFKPNEQIVLAPDLPSTQAFNVSSPAVQLLTSLPGLNKIPGRPKGDTSTAVTDLLSQGLSGGAPGAISAAIQAFAAKKDFFSGRPLQGNVAAPTYALPFSKDRVLNGKRQPTITTQQQFLAENLIPILGKIASAFPQGSYEQEKAPRRRLSTFTGVRAYPLGKGTQRGEALRRLGSLQQLLADLRSQGITVPSSRTKKTTGWGR